MKPKHPTPTTGGAWRVIDGQLVDESQLASADVVNAGDAAVHPLAAQDDPRPDPPTRRKAHTKAN